MPQTNVTDWSPQAIAEQQARLQAEGAEPRLTLGWLSAAERIQRDADRADEHRCAVLRAQSVRGANRIRYQR